MTERARNMETIVAPETSGRMAKLLAILSVACFWLLPFSPLIAIAALSATYRSTGWVRQTAVAGAILSAGFTILFAVLFIFAANSIPSVP